MILALLIIATILVQASLSLVIRRAGGFPLFALPSINCAARAHAHVYPFYPSWEIQNVSSCAWVHWLSHLLAWVLLAWAVRAQWAKWYAASSSRHAFSLHQRLSITCLLSAFYSWFEVEQGRADLKVSSQQNRHFSRAHLLCIVIIMKQSLVISKSLLNYLLNFLLLLLPCLHCFQQFGQLDDLLFAPRLFAHSHEPIALLQRALALVVQIDEIVELLLHSGFDLVVLCLIVDGSLQEINLQIALIFDLQLTQYHLFLVLLITGIQVPTPVFFNLIDGLHVVLDVYQFVARVNGVNDIVIIFKRAVIDVPALNFVKCLIDGTGSELSCSNGHQVCKSETMGIEFYDLMGGQLNNLCDRSPCFPGKIFLDIKLSFCGDDGAEIEGISIEDVCLVLLEQYLEDVEVFIPLPPKVTALLHRHNVFELHGRPKNYILPLLSLQSHGRPMLRHHYHFPRHCKMCNPLQNGFTQLSHLSLIFGQKLTLLLLTQLPRVHLELTVLIHQIFAAASRRLVPSNFVGGDVHLALGVLLIDQEGIVLVIQVELAALDPLLVSKLRNLLQVQLHLDLLPFGFRENGPADLPVGLNFGKVIQSNPHEGTARAFTMTLAVTLAVTPVFLDIGHAPIHLNHDLTVIQIQTAYAADCLFDFSYNLQWTRLPFMRSATLQSNNQIAYLSLFVRFTHYVRELHLLIIDDMTFSRQPIRTLVPAYLLIILANVGGALLMVPISLQLLINTCCCVYIGCLLSTCLAKDSKGHVLTFSKSLGEDESVISMADAKRFPLMASAFLFGFYMLFKVLPKEVFTSIINVYFSLTTVLSVSSIFVEYLPFTDSQRRILFSSNVPSFIQNILEIKKFEVSPAKILCLIGASLPVGFYFLTRHWSLNNIFAILFSLVGLKSLSLSTTKTGLFLMWALFFYDIFWVYGTDVMVTVAKNLDIPIKILFPYLNAEGDFKTSMVGLGDIVIPGIFVSLCLKFDIEAAFEKNKEIKEYSQIELPYFNMCLVGYFYGIIETFLAMFIFEHPQPALLFLVPMCTIPVLIRAFFRGEFLKFVEYDTELKVIEEQSGEKKQD